MEYLDKVLGVKVTYEDVEFKHGVTVLDAAYLIPFKAKHGWIWQIVRPQENTLIAKILRNITVFCELIPRTDTEDIRNPLLSSLRKAQSAGPHCWYSSARHWGTPDRQWTHDQGENLRHGFWPLYGACRGSDPPVPPRQALQWALWKPLSSSTAVSRSGNTLQYMVYPSFRRR